jgi:predicted acylesterase/phospholipase RssA
MFSSSGSPVPVASALICGEVVALVAMGQTELDGSSRTAGGPASSAKVTEDVPVSLPSADQEQGGEMWECDLVMRGGTTSGIVYPKAVVGLSKTYRFRQIGGASAGAIAASFAAAAEYGRQSNGFDRLNTIPSEFESGLAKYFQPYPAYRKLFSAVLALMEKNQQPGFFFFLWNALRIRRAVKDLPSTHFGVCPGTTTDTHAGPGLVDWLYRRLEYVAGRMATIDGKLPDTPLTFGDLRGRNIELRLITTNLSQRHPENLPIGRGFKVRRGDLAWLLPPSVAKWAEQTWATANGYADVPNGADMPVILAVRMSLAFPVLFSTVPLYTQDFSLQIDSDACKGAQDELRINHFSDGGLSSNFPIHYFDAPLPTRPTFGINLSDYHPCRQGKDDKDGWNRIYLPSQAGGGLTYGIHSISGVFAFLGALLMSAKDWQDSMQMRMPGFRERIVHVALKPDEGGTNLAMTKDTIVALIQLGERSAERILAGHNLDPKHQPPFDLQVHRWRRLLAATEALEEWLEQAGSAYLEQAPTGDPSIDSVPDFLVGLIKKMPAHPALFDELGYEPKTPHDVENLKARWDALVTLRNTWRQLPFDPAWNLPSPTVGVKFRPIEF